MKKIKKMALFLAVVAFAMSFPIGAFAATGEEVTTFLREAEAPEHFISLVSNFIKYDNPSAAQLDEIMEYGEKVVDLIDGRDPYSLSADENLQVLEWGTEAAEVLDLTMVYDFASYGPGADISVYDGDTLVMELNTRDNGVVKTGYAEPILIAIPVLLIMSFVAVFIITKKNQASRGE